MESLRQVTPGRLRRLAEELEDEGIPALRLSTDPDVLVDELDYALRPPSHEGRVPSYGAIVLPTVDAEHWADVTHVGVSLRRATDRSDDEVRRYADGAASWAVRTADGITGFAVFERSNASERDLVVIAEATGATVVQRDHVGKVRLVGPFGVARWDSRTWHLEPPVSSWLERASCGIDEDGTAVLFELLRFAVHDLGASHVGALLVLRPGAAIPPSFELRMPTPPEIQVGHPADLAPLYHVLRQVDGAAVFDEAGVLRHLGVRLVPSATAETDVPAFRGTRHTSARRYSHDDPDAVVIAVSEDGPVSVFRNGLLVGRSTELWLRADETGAAVAGTIEPTGPAGPGDSPAAADPAAASADRAQTDPQRVELETYTGAEAPPSSTETRMPSGSVPQ